MARRGSIGFSPARLGDALSRACISPAGLAEAAGTSPSDISKYLAGQAAPQPPRLAALARALDVPAASLLQIPESGEGLAHIRSAAGLTQAQLAERAGIGLKRYELAERGQRPLSHTDITQLAAAAETTAARIRAAHDRDVTRSSGNGT
jgi:transcriptional regulator with XRE-family HTH domain